jgi:hypothetical protein
VFPPRLDQFWISANRNSIFYEFNRRDGTLPTALPIGIANRTAECHNGLPPPIRSHCRRGREEFSNVRELTVTAHCSARR